MDPAIFPAALSPGVLAGAFLACLGFVLALRRAGYTVSGKDGKNSLPWLFLFSQMLAGCILVFF